MKSLLAVLSVAIAFTACSEKPAAPAKVVLPPKVAREPQTEAAPSTTGNSPAQPPAASAKELLTSPEFADMNKLVEFFYDKNQRVPTMDELKRACGERMPTPPVGYTFAIDAPTKKVKLIENK